MSSRADMFRAGARKCSVRWTLVGKAMKRRIHPEQHECGGSLSAGLDGSSRRQSWRRRLHRRVACTWVRAEIRENFTHFLSNLLIHR